MLSPVRVKNFFVTGPPGSGKSRLIFRVVEMLKQRGIRVAGITCPEVRIGGVRWGFKLVNIETGEEEVLASVDVPSGPRVSKYRVNIPGLERATKWLEDALHDPSVKVLVIDEVGKMECFSEYFVRVTREALNSPKPVIGVVGMRPAHPLMREVHTRPDTRVYFVRRGMSESERERIAREIYEQVLRVLGSERE